MSNTLKFGGGQWATKVGSTLAYNDENGNFKPLPFNFTRATSATRVNKQGLIEVVTNNKPRIDFKDDANGALLLEPQRSNQVTYSEDLTQGSNLLYTEVTANSSTSPDGSVNADKLVAGTTNGLQLRVMPTTSLISGNTYTFSAFVKNSGGNYIIFYINDSSSQGIKVNLINQTFTIMGNSTNHFIENYNNGWFRIGFTRTVDQNLSGVNLVPSLDGENVSFLGDGVNGIFCWGIQAEQGSYATSYIPTQGSVGTRVAESCSQTPPSGIIGQTEGTMYAEIDFKSKPEAGSPIVGIMALNNNVTNLQNCIILGIERKSGGVNRFYPFVQVGNSTTASIIGSTLTDGNYKVAFAYKQNDFILYVNGVQIGTDTNGAVPTTSQVLVGERYNGDTFKIADGIKETKLYNTRLSNAELAALTT